MGPESHAVTPNRAWGGALLALTGILTSLYAVMVQIPGNLAGSPLDNGASTAGQCKWKETTQHPLELPGMGEVFVDITGSDRTDGTILVAGPMVLLAETESDVTSPGEMLAAIRALEEAEGMDRDDATNAVWLDMIGHQPWVGLIIPDEGPPAPVPMPYDGWEAKSVEVVSLGADRWLVLWLRGERDPESPGTRIEGLGQGVYDGQDWHDVSYLDVPVEVDHVVGNTFAFRGHSGVAHWVITGPRDGGIWDMAVVVLKREKEGWTTIVHSFDGASASAYAGASAEGDVLVTSHPMYEEDTHAISAFPADDPSRRTVIGYGDASGLAMWARGYPDSLEVLRQEQNTLRLGTRSDPDSLLHSVALGPAPWETQAFYHSSGRWITVIPGERSAEGAVLVLSSIEGSRLESFAQVETSFDAAFFDVIYNRTGEVVILGNAVAEDPIFGGQRPTTQVIRGRIECGD